MPARFRLRTQRHDVTVQGRRFRVVLVEHHYGDVMPQPPPVWYGAQIYADSNESMRNTLLPVHRYQNWDEALRGAKQQIEEYLNTEGSN